MRATKEYTRGRFLSGLLAASTAVINPSVLGAANAATDAVLDEGLLEDRLIELLQMGGPGGAMLSPLRVTAIEQTIAQLVSVGGSQKLAAEGIGSWGSWLGSWDILYGPINPSQGAAQLVSARQFVYGPLDTKADLKGTGRNGGTSTEYLYSLPTPPAGTSSSASQHLLVRRTGEFTKLEGYEYRIAFAQPVEAYRLEPGPPAAPTPAGTPVRSPPPTLLTSRAMSDAFGSGAAGELDLMPDGASLRQITYLSERLWISQQEMPHPRGDVRDESRPGGSTGRGDGVLVLRRSDAAPMLPPADRPDLTSTCAEAIFVRGAICRPSLRDTPQL